MEKEMKTVNFNTIKDGEHFTYNGIEFVRLGKEQEGILCITAKIWKSLPFDKDSCNNFEDSFICNELNNGEFITLFNMQDICIQTVDLTADNGDKSYGKTNVYVGLLSADLYRKYRDYIPSYNDWVWLCTPWYCSGNVDVIRYVNTDGTLGSGGVRGANGVVPTVIFKE